MGKMSLSESERRELESMRRKRKAATGQVWRAKLPLLFDEGASRNAITNALSCDSRFIATWRARFTEERLAGHPKVSMHSTVPYCSWLNQAENGFGRIRRDVLASGIFTGITGLHKKLMRYIRQDNANAKPLKWQDADPSCRIRYNSSGSAV